MQETISLKKSTIQTGIFKHSTKNYISSARKVIRTPWRFALYKMIFRADTLASKIFAVALLSLILLSSTAVILKTVPEYKLSYSSFFILIEWLVLIIFTIEYFLRILCLPRPIRYIFSPLGLIDFFAIFPIYLSLFHFTEIESIHFLFVIRLVRLFRLFKVFDLVEYSGEANILISAIQASRYKIAVFILAVIVSVTIIGSLMYVIEGPENGFVSIPKGIYWGVVTITTVGYGDVAPKTPAGQALASLLMLLGFSMIVVPTSIVSAEIASHHNDKKVLDNKSCLDCGMPGHDLDAHYCKYCGSKLWENEH